jgi:3-oxoacyl-[acyl-carrier protein] reductase
VIVTGAGHGLGVAVARASLEAGARVFLCARDGHSLESVRDQLARIGPATHVEVLQADVAEPDDVRRLVAGAIEAFGRVDILVNNAGIQGPIGRVEEVDWSEWVEAVRVNLLGSVLCCREVLPHLRANGYGKIIQLSGGGATSPRPFFSAYAASKAAVVRFVETLAEETRDANIDVNAVAPGVLKTRMLDQILSAGAERVGASAYEQTVESSASGGMPLELAARLIVFLGSSASDGITGRLISAPWDPWETLASRRNELDATDIYTLRRIVPRDRGHDWGKPAWSEPDAAGDG